MEDREEGDFEEGMDDRDDEIEEGEEEEGEEAEKDGEGKDIDEIDEMGESEIITEGQPTEKITTKYMTKYEKARLLGTRALQISMGAPIMVENDFFSVLLGRYINVKHRNRL